MTTKFTPGPWEVQFEENGVRKSAGFFKTLRDAVKSWSLSHYRGKRIGPGTYCLFNCGGSGCDVIIVRHDKAKLRCQTCNDKGKVSVCVTDVNGWEIVPCPDCSLSAAIAKAEGGAQ